MVLERREQLLDVVALDVGERAEDRRTLIVALAGGLELEDRETRAEVQLRAKEREQVLERGVRGMDPAEIRQAPAPRRLGFGCGHEAYLASAGLGFQGDLLLDLGRGLPPLHGADRPEVQGHEPPTPWVSPLRTSRVRRIPPE